MKKNKTKVHFINHASILIEHNDISLLSDPWYQGDVFHKGWNLIHELQDEEIDRLLDKVSHIWISHEHPDHFSILFFKKFGQKIKSNKIKLLFQAVSDKRVEDFLVKSGYDLQILTYDLWTKLSDDFDILCFKDGFYDSGLAVKTSDKTILNLNDCEINNEKKLSKLVSKIGKCDILATQFSYAAWKGGVENSSWRRLAAKEKIETMKLQSLYFEPKMVIPFASYIYFSNYANFYLNDASNNPNDVIEAFKKEDTTINVMKPFESFENLEAEVDNKESIEFWDYAYNSIDKRKLNSFDTVSFKELEESFNLYTDRIFKRNSRWFMQLVKYLSPLSAFKPVVINIYDLEITVNLDLFSNNLKQTSSNPDISMSSESLKFLLKNTFGFDTLTVNGCFEESSVSGFSRAARTLAIENLNNMGFQFRPQIIFNFDIIVMFISRLWAVSKKINLLRS